MYLSEDLLNSKTKQEPNYDTSKLSNKTAQSSFRNALFYT